ncbi:TPSN protein, partial [Bucco capensis]|nr:TPSN protein [Bucco capensis]
WGALSKLWIPPRRPLLKCELSSTLPTSVGPQPWHPSPQSPPTLGGSWWLLAMESPGYAVSSLLKAPGAPRSVTASLSIFTLTPELRSSPGSPLDLHCAFVAPPGPFSLEWRHQHQGNGQQLLTYHSATNQVPLATPGVQLLLEGTAGDIREVTLRLAPLEIKHQGTFICSIFLPQGEIQQLLEVQVLEPPKVSLHPSPLVVAPGFGAELLCDTSNYFPLEVEVKWQRCSGSSKSLLPLEDTLLQTWTSSPHQGANGTFSKSSGARLGPVQPQHHGDVYVCLVSHQALAKPLRVEVQLEVAGVAGPSIEDMVGLFLLAYILCGLWHCLCP